MGKAKRLLQNFYRPNWWVSTAYPVLLDELMDRYFAHFPRGGCEIMDEDWDNLLIIDACRYDMFEQQNTISGRLESRVSQGSTTFEYFEANFLDTEYHETVYVTANPVPHSDYLCSVDLNDVFYDVIDVWDGAWDGELNTVPPEHLAGHLFEAASAYPNKRIIGHFVQPHHPFLGEKGSEIDEKGMTPRDNLPNKSDASEKQVWEKLEDGTLSRDLVWEAYRENLDIVLDPVERLCDELDGKTVVTSDHGNLVGEFAWPFPKREYGHPPGVHTTKLVKVPWLVVESHERREIVSEKPTQSDPVSDETESLERLEGLGYR